MTFRNILLSLLLPIILSNSPVMAHTDMAEFKKSEGAIKYRQSVFTIMAHSFSKIGAVVKGESPYSQDEVAKNAVVVTMLSSLPWQAFGPGTEGGNAKLEVWSKHAQFESAAQKMQVAVTNLNNAVQSGNQSSIKKAFGTAGQTCKACHDDFKKKH